MIEAGELGKRFERLAHGLSAHPTRMIIGPPQRFTDDTTEWDIVPTHCRAFEGLVALTDDIRAAALNVNDLREQASSSAPQAA